MMKNTYCARHARWKACVENKEWHSKSSAKKVEKNISARPQETPNARVKEDINDLKIKRENTVLWRHIKVKHEGNKQDFKCNVRSLFGRNVTLRQVSESVEIRR